MHRILTSERKKETKHAEEEKNIFANRAIL